MEKEKTEDQINSNSNENNKLDESVEFFLKEIKLIYG